MDSGFRAVDSGFQSLDSRSFPVELGFRIPIVSGIPDSYSCIPDSKPQDSGFHWQKFPGFRNPDSLTCIKGSRTVWDSGFRIPVILGDPGADSGGEGKSKRAEKYGTKKVKNGVKSPWGQCLTRPVPKVRRRSAFLLVPENLCFSGTNQKPFGNGLVRHCPQGLFTPFFTFLRALSFRPFRLSFAPTICPWVSEDVSTKTN